MDSLKIQIKHDEHEFSAEGNEATVKELFQKFQETVAASIARTPAAPPAKPLARNVGNDDPDQPTRTKMTLDKVTDADLEHVYKIDEDKLRLRLYPDDQGDKPRQARECVLLILLGMKALFGRDEASSVSVAESLRQTGITIDRLNDVALSLLKEGMITKMGLNRGTTYRITLRGITRAEETIQALREKY